MKMTIITKEWNTETGELESENKYVSISKKGKDGLMHNVKKEFKIIKGREIKWDDLPDGKNKGKSMGNQQ